MIRLCRKRLTFAPTKYLSKDKNDEKEDIFDTVIGMWHDHGYGTKTCPN